MTECGNDRLAISRRAALAGTALALGAAAISPAAGQEKLAQALAKYQGSPNGDKHCALCDNFQAPNSCKFVAGEISPNGWRQLFTPKA